MSEWGRRTFGDPCRDCGFEWDRTWAEAVALVSEIARSMPRLLAGADPSRRHPGLGWSVKEYVCHVVDNLRISSERLVGAARGGSAEVGAYHQDELARARNYAHVPIEGAFWSLERAVHDWTTAIEEAEGKGVVLLHPERGRQTVLDVCLNNTHDVAHHRWDILRTLSSET